MESFNFYSKFESISIPIQIIKLYKSFFVYVGSPQLSFDNLTVSHVISDESSLSNVNTCTIYHEEYSEIGKSLSNKLAMKFKSPFYLSFNLPDEAMNVNRELYFTIEKDLFDSINKLIN